MSHADLFLMSQADTVPMSHADTVPMLHTDTVPMLHIDIFLMSHADIFLMSPASDRHSTDTYLQSASDLLMVINFLPVGGTALRVTVLLSTSPILHKSPGDNDIHSLSRHCSAYSDLTIKGWMTRQIFFGRSESACLETYLSQVTVQ